MKFYPQAPLVTAGPRGVAEMGPVLAERELPLCAVCSTVVLLRRGGEEGEVAERHVCTIPLIPLPR